MKTGTLADTRAGTIKYRIRIDGHYYEVEIQDLNTTPIVAVVDGEQFELWPESAGPAVPENTAAAPKAPGMARPPAKAQPGGAAGNPPGGAASTSGNGALKTLRAPIPGVVISIAVQAGAEVTAGQELCVLEAMKMKNSIRATRSGKIASIAVTNGQHVKHQEVLMEYEG